MRDFGSLLVEGIGCFSEEKKIGFRKMQKKSQTGKSACEPESEEFDSIA